MVKEVLEVVIEEVELSLDGEAYKVGTVVKEMYDVRR